MRPPAELDDVAWDALTHAYGSAEDVPELIRALYQEDAEVVDEAVDELYGNIHHQGTVYEASAPAVPFLAHAARHATHQRGYLLMLLAVLAAHDPDFVNSSHWQSSSVAAICTELCRALPDLLPCLGDPERDVRRATLRAVAAVADLLPGQERAVVAEQVRGLYLGDPVPAVRADAVVCLDHLGCEEDASAHPLPEVRLAAAVLAVRRSQPPYPDELVEATARDGAEPDHGDDDFPWPGEWTQDEELRHLLREDPRAALTVADRWIAAGDLGSRGSWLVDAVVETWRDQEAEALALFQAALARHQDSAAVAARLRAIGHWIVLLPEPGNGIRDTLHDHAGATDDTSAAAARVADQALHALVRSRDPRALELVLRRPSARLLKAAARHFPVAGDGLIPLIRSQLAAGATGNDGIALVQALGAFGAAARQARTELADCLRTGRAAVVAVHQLGANGEATPEIVALLAEASTSTHLSLRAAAAAAHHQLTGETRLALTTFEGLLTAPGSRTASHLVAALEPLGAAAAPLLPLIEPLLEGDGWTRLAAAEALHWITGTPDLAVPALASLVGASPVGLRALRALAATGQVPDELRPVLRGFAFSPRRLLADSPVSGQEHADEELRALALAMLSSPGA